MRAVSSVRVSTASGGGRRRVGFWGEALLSWTVVAAWADVEPYPAANYCPASP